MKPGRDSRLATWCAIFIAVVSLVFSSRQGCALKSKMVEVSEVNQRISARIDDLKASKIDDKLASQQAKIFMSKWRDYAELQGFVHAGSESPRVYEVRDSGLDLVNILEPGLFLWLRERKKNHPENKIEDILTAVNEKDLYRALFEYNKKHDTSFSLESVFGILVAYLDHKASEIP